MINSLKWNIAQHLELRWWKKYLRNKDADQYLQWKRKYWHAFLKPVAHLIHLDPLKEILDAGCGPAGIFIILKEKMLTKITAQNEDIAIAKAAPIDPYLGTNKPSPKKVIPNLASPK